MKCMNFLINLQEIRLTFNQKSTQKLLLKAHKTIFELKESQISIKLIRNS